MRNQVASAQENLTDALALPSDEAVPWVAVKARLRDFGGDASEYTDQDPSRPTRRILVPTDFSQRSSRAVEHAAILARQSGATLTLLHVIDVNPPAAATHCGSATELMRQLWLTGTVELARLKKSLEENQVRIQTLIVEGLPSEAIVEHSSGFDLLVISGPQPKSSWNFFSKHTARRVIEQAQCPVRRVCQETGLQGRMFASEAKATV